MIVVAQFFAEEAGEWRDGCFPAVRVEVPAARRVRLTVEHFSFVRGQTRPPPMLGIDVDEALSSYVRDGVRKMLGGELHFPAVGFWRDQLRLERVPVDWCSVYHGTAYRNLRRILQHGFEIPDEVGPGHIPRYTPLFGVADFAGAVFVTQSYRYACKYSDRAVAADDPIVAFGGSSGPWARSGDFKDSRVIVTLIEVRVRPGQGTYRKFPSTIEQIWSDELVDTAELEWRVPNPRDAMPTAVLRCPLTIDENEKINCASLDRGWTLPEEKEEVVESIAGRSSLDVMMEWTEEMADGL
jgi:hypothetical protein